MKYKVTITETLEKEVIVSARSPEDALSKVKQDYRDEVHVLDASNHTGTDFSVDLLQRERDYER